jgi:type IV pilus assembly protein PilA
MVSLMKARLAERERDEDGFTLIELMVVVLIIAILIAIAIPTFLGARQKAQDRAAQSDLRNALTAAKTGYVDTEDYATVNLASIEPSLTYVSGAASTGPKSISVNATKTGVGMAALADDNVCWQLYDSTDAATAGTTYGSAGGGGGCNAPGAPIAQSASVPHPDHW